MLLNAAGQDGRRNGRISFGRICCQTQLDLEPIWHSLTYHQSKEMSLHAELRERTGVNGYFCDSHSHWQCGICEFTNDLLYLDLDLYLPNGQALLPPTEN